MKHYTLLYFWVSIVTLGFCVDELMSLVCIFELKLSMSLTSTGWKEKNNTVKIRNSVTWI